MRLSNSNSEVTNVLSLCVCVFDVVWQNKDLHTT